MNLIKKARCDTKCVEIRAFISRHHADMGLFTPSDLLQKNRDKPAYGVVGVRCVCDLKDFLEKMSEFENMNVNSNYVLISEDGHRDYTASYQDAKKHLAAPSR